MGCDIHIILERKLANSNRWIGVWTDRRIPSKTGHIRVCHRDYDFFAQLAGVRGRKDYDKPHGHANFIPEDISELALQEMAFYGDDGHSHGHISVEKFCEVWKAVNEDCEMARHKHLEYDLFGIELDYPENAEYRVLFFFDN